MTVLAAADEAGRGFNVPNDGVVHPRDGSIWFTDPGTRRSTWPTRGRRIIRTRSTRSGSDDVDGVTLRNPPGVVTTALDGRIGAADGIRCDEDGNIWAAMGWAGDGYDGVHVFAPDGTRIGQIRLPEVCGNLGFGGSRRNRLFMAASQSLYAVFVETRGAHIT